MDFEKTLQLVGALEAHEVEYVVVGGVAMNLQGFVRATDDLDLFVSPLPANVARIKAALKSLWNDPAIDEIRADDLQGEFAVITYGPPEDDIAVDFISRLGEAFRYDQIEGEYHTYEGVRCRVATPAMLYRMKRNTVRPIDQIDAVNLRDRFGYEDDPHEP